jgi:uncharacterized protein YfiM (DUF2279 family)
MKSFVLLLLFTSSTSLLRPHEPSLDICKAAYLRSAEQAEQNEDPWFAMDKFLHVAASASITGLSYHVYHCQYHNPLDRSVYFSLSLAGASGIGKELYDIRIRKTHWSWKDIAADGVGMAIGYLLFIHLDT